MILSPSGNGTRTGPAPGNRGAEIERHLQPLPAVEARATHLGEVPVWAGIPRAHDGVGLEAAAGEDPGKAPIGRAILCCKRGAIAAAAADAGACSGLQPRTKRVTAPNEGQHVEKRRFVGGHVGVDIIRSIRKWLALLAPAIRKPMREENWSRDVAMLCTTKRIDDAEPVVEHDSVLHIFGP